MDYQSLLQEVYYGNSVQAYLHALGLFSILFVVFRIFRYIILGKLRKFADSTETKFDDKLVDAFESIHPRFYDLTGLYFTLHSLHFTDTFDKTVNAVFLAAVIIQLLIASQKLIEYFLHKALKNDETNETDQMMFSGVNLFIRIGLWATGVLLFLSNMGFNISSLAASLGIGGIAVALAVQNILGDIFSSFSIYFDKPFAVGDFIVVGTDMGNVERIGMKTTRLRALQGEEIVISNKELTAARIQNFKKMQKRRVMFEIGITYSSNLEQCKQVPPIMDKVFSEFPNVDLDRASFREFGDFSLIYEIVYYHSSGDYKEYMLEREAINFRIKEEFDSAGIDMAFPTQTLYVEK